MIGNIDLIQKRRVEVAREIVQHEDAITSLRRELDELDTAGRVMARLTNSEWPPELSMADLPVAATPHPDVKPANHPTMPEMIIAVLKKARDTGRIGLEPKSIHAQIVGSFWADAKAEAVSSIAWRMWKRGDLEKDGAVYRMPQKNEAASLFPSREPAASDQQPTALRPVEPAPGRGT